MDLRGARCFIQTSRLHRKKRVKEIREIVADLLKQPTFQTLQLDAVKVLANMQEMDKTTEFEMWWITKDGKLVHDSTVLTEFVDA
jgi:hypothetical protein